MQYSWQKFPEKGMELQISQPKQTFKEKSFHSWMKMKQEFNWENFVQSHHSWGLQKLTTESKTCC